MTPPHWKPVGDEQIAAFTAFVIDELKRLRRAVKRAEFDRRVGNSAHVEDPASVTLLEDLINIETMKRLGRKTGWIVTPPPKRGAPKKDNSGADGYSPSLQNAVSDVIAMKAIFRLHWQKERRTSRPTREEIAGERWKLSKQDQQLLEDHFAK